MINKDALVKAAEMHIKRGASMMMDPKVIIELAGNSLINFQLFDALQDCMWHGSRDWNDWLYKKVRSAIEAAKPTQSGDYQTPDNER